MSMVPVVRISLVLLAFHLFISQILCGGCCSEQSSETGNTKNGGNESGGLTEQRPALLPPSPTSKKSRQVGNKSSSSSVPSNSPHHLVDSTTPHPTPTPFPIDHYPHSAQQPITLRPPPVVAHSLNKQASNERNTSSTLINTTNEHGSNLTNSQLKQTNSNSISTDANNKNENYSPTNSINSSSSSTSSVFSNVGVISSKKMLDIGNRQLTSDQKMAVQLSQGVKQISNCPIGRNELGDEGQIEEEKKNENGNEKEQKKEKESGSTDNEPLQTDNESIQTDNESTDNRPLQIEKEEVIEDEDIPILFSKFTLAAKSESKKEMLLKEQFGLKLKQNPIDDAMEDEEEEEESFTFDRKNQQEQSLQMDDQLNPDSFNLKNSSIDNRDELKVNLIQDSSPVQLDGCVNELDENLHHHPQSSCQTLLNPIDKKLSLSKEEWKKKYVTWAKHLASYKFIPNWRDIAHEQLRLNKLEFKRKKEERERKEREEQERKAQDSKEKEDSNQENQPKKKSTNPLSKYKPSDLSVDILEATIRSFHQHEKEKAEAEEEERLNSKHKIVQVFWQEGSDTITIKIHHNDFRTTIKNVEWLPIEPDTVVTYDLEYRFPIYTWNSEEEVGERRDKVASFSEFIYYQLFVDSRSRSPLIGLGGLNRVIGVLVKDNPPTEEQCEWVVKLKRKVFRWKDGVLCEEKGKQEKRREKEEIKKSPTPNYPHPPNNGLKPIEVKC